MAKTLVLKPIIGLINTTKGVQKTQKGMRKHRRGIYKKNRRKRSRKYRKELKSLISCKKITYI
jgi:hypothetical protein